MADTEEPTGSEEATSPEEELLELNAADLGLDDEEGDPDTDTAGKTPEDSQEAADLEAFLEDFEQQQMQEAAEGLQRTPEAGEDAGAAPPEESAAAAPDEPAPEESGAEPDLEDMADLLEEEPAEPTPEEAEAFEGAEAFEFEEGETGAEAAGAEPVADSAEDLGEELEGPAAEREPVEELPGEELDLSFDEPEEEPPPAAGGEAAEAAEPERAAAPVEEATAPAVALADDEPPRKEGSGRMWTVAVVLLVLALVASVGSGLLSYTLGERVASLASAVRHLQEQDDGAQDAASSGELRQAMRQVRQLDERVSELAVMIEGPLSHLRESRQEERTQVTSRLDSLERGLTALREDIAGVEERIGGLASTGGAPAPTGDWSVNLASFRSQGAAEKALARLQAAGIDAQRQRVASNGTTWHRLRVAGFASKQEAASYAREVESKTDLEDIWVSKD